MGTWGAGNFESDSALDYINEQIDRYLGVIEAIFDDPGRFRLDEDAEGMLIPSVALLSLLCQHCHGALPRRIDVVAWKARYLDMYDAQIDGLEPAEDYKRQRRDEIAATFDTLLQWQP
jgi:hypothetical protein